MDNEDEQQEQKDPSSSVTMTYDPLLAMKTNDQGVGDDDDGDLALITLEHVEMSHFYSADGVWPSSNRHNREGFITVRIGGQASILGFTIDGSNAPSLSNDMKDRLLGTILFLGKIPTILPLSVEVMESDEEQRAALAKATMMLKSPGHFGNVPVVNTGFQLIASLLDVAKTATDDDSELLLETSWFNTSKYNNENAVPLLPPLGHAFQSGTHTVTRKGPSDDDGISLSFKVERFTVRPKNAPIPKRHTISVLLHKLELQNPRNVGRGDVVSIYTTFGIAKHTTIFETDVAAVNRDAYWFDIATVSNRLLYHGPLDPVLPFEAKIQLRRIQNDVDTAGIVNSGINFVKETKTGNDDEAEWKARLDELTKAVSSSRDIAREFIRSKEQDDHTTRPLLTVSGVLAPCTGTTHTVQGVEGRTFWKVLEPSTSTDDDDNVNDWQTAVLKGPHATMYLMVRTETS